MMRMSGDKTSPQPGDSAASQPVATTNIYVASQQIPIGTTIKPEMLAVQAWPSHLVLENFVKADDGQPIAGMVARATFQQQEPILTTKLSNANDPNFLAGSLPKGMRVLTIQTSEIEGVAGFVFPGDYVDVILTHAVTKWVTPPASLAGGVTQTPEQQPDAVTETLLTNVKVLAVDQRASGGAVVDENGKMIVPRSVSLMVSPTDAQRLRLGAQKGTLTLALRSLQDRESSDPLTLTVNKDVSQYPESGVVGGNGDGTAGGAVLVVRGIDAKENTSLPAPGQQADAMTPPVPAGEAAATTQMQVSQ